MADVWDQVRIDQLINDKVEERTELEYKAAKALDLTNSADEKKKEIAKDVSAMANSAGGVVIYGVSEDPVNRHLPEAEDPVKRSSFSKERLEQIINSGIQPKIKGLIIHPVVINGSNEDVVYVVEIPQSDTAHQVTANSDCRYYKRFNFIVEKMQDYEIRDVMNRAVKPDALPEFYIVESDEELNQQGYDLNVRVSNIGNRPIRNYKLMVEIGGAVDWMDQDHLMIDHSMWNNSETSLTLGDPGDASLSTSINIFTNRLLFAIRSDRVLFPLDQHFIRSFCVHYPIRDSNQTWEQEYNDQVWTIEWTLYADDMERKTGRFHITELQKKLKELQNKR